MKKSFCILGMIFSLGMTAFNVVSIFILNCHTYGYLDSAKFGADFYTYMYRATSGVYSNTNGIGSFLEEMMLVFCITFAIIGLVLFCFFGIKLADARKTSQPAPAPMPAAAYGGTDIN